MRQVAVTGANGYMASHLVQKLLQKGYTVIGTVRDPQNNSKVGHLRTLPNAEQNLKLVQADFENEENRFIQAFQGVECVFHTANPVFFDGNEENLVNPPVYGTEKILQAVEANKNTIKNFVYTSSTASIIASQEPFGKDTWSNEEYMRQTGFWYALGKTLAEKKVHQYCQAQDWLNYACILPTLIQGPVLGTNQPNFTLKDCIIDIIKGDDYTVGELMFSNIVDVRDVAEMHLNAFEKNIQQGRFIAIGDVNDIEVFGNSLKKVCQQEGVEEKIILRKYEESQEQFKHKWEDRTESLDLLGKEFIKLDQCLLDTVKSIKGVYV